MKKKKLIQCFTMGSDFGWGTGGQLGGQVELMGGGWRVRGLVGLAGCLGFSLARISRRGLENWPGRFSDEVNIFSAEV